MAICKNASEYQRELDRLISDCYREIRQKEVIIEEKYREPLDHSDVIEWRAIQREYEKEISDLYHESIKPVLNFENSQPKKPRYIYKKKRRYFEVKYSWDTGDFKISKKPLNLLLFFGKNPEWDIELSYSGIPLDQVPCPKCKREFLRYHPNQKYCPRCQRSPRSKKPKSSINQNKKRHTKII